MQKPRAEQMVSALPLPAQPIRHAPIKAAGIKAQ
jgi:hypothetical protein